MGPFIRFRVSGLLGFRGLGFRVVRLQGLGLEVAGLPGFRDSGLGLGFGLGVLGCGGVGAAA